MSSPKAMVSLLLSVPLAAALAACRTAPPPPPFDPPPLSDDFSAERAWAHLEALTALGPRPTGSEGAARAREYIASQLAQYGIEAKDDPVEIALGDDRPPLEVSNLVAVLPGASDDLFLLMAQYDTRQFDDFAFVGANEGASGAALLLELARVLAQRPLHYTTWLVFLGAEAERNLEGFERRASHLSSTGLVQRLAEDGLASRLRLAVAFQQVCDADLRIARDLASNRAYREEFWRAAERTGRTDVFTRDSGFETPGGAHLPFLRAGHRRVVAISDTSFGGEEPPGIYAGTVDDTIERCAASSLEAVGEVTLEALETISRRLAKIDRFSSAPLSEIDEEFDALFETPGAETPEGGTRDAPEAEPPDTRPASEGAADGS